MKTKCLAAFAIMFVTVAGLFAQEGAGDAETKLPENPNDAAAINTYIGAKFGAAIKVMKTDPEQAEKILDDLATQLATLSPDDDRANELLRRAKMFMGLLKSQIELQKTSIAEIVKKLESDPADTKTIKMYGMKVGESAGPFARSEPEKAEGELKKAKEFLRTLREKAKDNEDVAQAISDVERGFGPIEQMIEAAKRLLSLIGEDATPLQVEAWVNGEPLSEADLKGKVLLLDFWAVWCGPCIATFPHLREWNEEYADKGLVMIGVTKYYNYAWDTEAGKEARSKEQVSAEDEQAMLAKFAEQHDLRHRIAVEREREMSEFYTVTGIPQVVVIDRAGKIRLIKVGSGAESIKEIGEMLATLIAE